MIKIDKEKIGRIIKIKSIEMDLKTYNDIKELHKYNSIRKIQDEIVKRYNVETKTEAFYIINAILNNFKYLKVVEG